MVRAILESPVPLSSRPVFRFATFGVLAAALLLAGCGRKGPLDPPPAASLAQPAAEAQPGAGAAAGQTVDYGADGKPLAPKGQKKKLPIDWLID